MSKWQTKLAMVMVISVMASTWGMEPTQSLAPVSNAPLDLRQRSRHRRRPRPSPRRLRG